MGQDEQAGLAVSSGSPIAAIGPSVVIIAQLTMSGGSVNLAIQLSTCSPKDLHRRLVFGQPIGQSAIGTLEAVARILAGITC
jgi:hypothetical protein